MSISDDIEKLYKLRQENIISEEEYQSARKKLFEDIKEKRSSLNINGFEDNIWCLFIHLSQFASYAVPIAGIIIPIVLWQIKKKDSSFIDKHGKIVANWIFTYLILFVIFLSLSFVIIGIPFLVVLIVLGIIFPIIGAIKANDYEVWVYPFSIRFFKID